METLVVTLKNKSEAQKIKGVLTALKAHFEVIEEMEDKIFGEMIAEGKKSGTLTEEEQETFFNSLR